MPTPLYHTGGHSLADLSRDLYQLFHSLSKVQDALAELFISGEIVPSEDLGQDWYLKWASVYEEGDDWVRFGGRKIMIVVAGQPRDPAEIRYHSPFSEPRPPIPSESAVGEAPPQPDADPPSTTTEEDPPANDAALLPPGNWHILTVVLAGWHRGGLSAPAIQEYFARLVKNGAIKLSEALPASWMLNLVNSGSRVTGEKHFLFIAPGGKELWSDEIGCQLRDPRILNPRLLHLFLAPAVVETPPKGDIDPPSEGQPGTAPEPEAASSAGPAVVSRRGKDPEHNWKDAAGYAEEKTEKTKLPRRPDDSPNIQRGVDLMREWFEKYDPPPPRDGSIRRWIKDNWPRTSQWWGD